MTLNKPDKMPERLKGNMGEITSRFLLGCLSSFLQGNESVIKIHLSLCCFLS